MVASLYMCVRLEQKQKRAEILLIGLPHLCSLDTIYAWLLKFIFEIQRKGRQRVFPNPFKNLLWYTLVC